jgi:uncharacterized protein (DUF924 family)
MRAIDAGEEMTMNPQAQSVYDFWFPAGTALPRKEWFVKKDAFDQLLRGSFGVLVEQAQAGGLRAWDGEGPKSALARILLLDQFARNIYRGTALAFAGDHLALQAAQDMVDADDDQALPPLARAFVYMPFEHAEDMAMQDQSVALFTLAAQAEPMLKDMLDYARRHREVIARFGRFPHRNAILGRASTPEETAFLQQPGSGF